MTGAAWNGENGGAMGDEEAPDLSTRTILIVEDETDSAEVITRVLERLGAADVTVTANGVEALAHVEVTDPEPELVFVDIVMPEMGGVELLRALADRGYSGTEEANMSALKRVAEFRGLNVLGTVAKPVSRNGVVEVLKGL